MNTSERIKMYRELRNLTQKDLGERLGVSQSFIHQLEANIRNISVGKLVALCNELDCTPNDILGFTEEMEK